MPAEACLYLLHARTPIHVGVDQGLGAIDLPTMRAVHTGDPLIPGSSVKGVLRDLAERDPRYNRDPKSVPSDREYQLMVEAAFGPPQERAGDFQGGLVFGDAQLVALPVRSLSGAFAWVTCRRLLRRFNEDAAVAGAPGLAIPDATAAQEDGAGLVCTNSRLLVEPRAQEKQVFLEDLLFSATPDKVLDLVASTLADLYWPGDAEAKAELEGRLMLVTDDVFAFYARTALEVRARVKLNDETGTAAASGPWTEEHLPTETLLFGLALGRQTVHVRRPRDGEKGEERTGRSRADGLGALKELLEKPQTLRFGGHATIGLGRATARLAGGAG